MYVRDERWYMAAGGNSPGPDGKGILPLSHGCERMMLSSIVCSR